MEQQETAIENIHLYEHPAATSGSVGPVSQYPSSATQQYPPLTGSQYPQPATQPPPSAYPPQTAYYHAQQANKQQQQEVVSCTVLKG